MLLAPPFTIFDQIAALGLEVEIYCHQCHHRAKADPAGALLRGKRFVDVRFRCQQLISPGHNDQVGKSLVRICLADEIQKLVAQRSASPLTDFERHVRAFEIPRAECPETDQAQGFQDAQIGCALRHGFPRIHALEFRVCSRRFDR